MNVTDTTNHYFQLANQFVNQTNRHIFLTGKAGTGKTTFLKHIREHSLKKMAIVAPTGVAAINAGGVTLHSFFQLPFGAFIPVLHGNEWNSHLPINNPHTLFKNLRLSRDRRELMQELELLVIDEVSMLRSDLLDAIDLILRHVRHQPLLPFGGVQVLYIGDLFQLPPVVAQEEWELLKEHYKSPFFFDAQVMQQAPPVYLELKKIYRQHEAEFIRLLNNIRNNQATKEDLERLHQHYRPGFESSSEEKYITLTTHNAKADAINQQQLHRLPGSLFEFEGEITKDFNEKALPAEKMLQLKPGAQIMFIKNDKGETRRYYNGKIGTIVRIEDKTIYVAFPDSEVEMELEKETWRNIRYKYNREKDTIEEEELGTFTQYPIRLAWAITIHKSQGLTFNKAIIDAGASFAPGQVYVAMSRLTSLEGLILLSRIHSNCINTDERVLTFTKLEAEEAVLHSQLEQDQQAYLLRTLVQCFNWSRLTESLEENYENYEQHQVAEKNMAVAWAKNVWQQSAAQHEMAMKFIRQLDQLLPAAAQDGYSYLHQRVTAAVNYFKQALNETIASFKEHMESVRVKQRVRKYIGSLQELVLLQERKQQELEEATLIADGLLQGLETSVILQSVEASRKASKPIITEPEEKKTGRAPKGETKKISLQLLREGKTIAEIASVRGLTSSTIETHLISFITTGEVDIKDVVEAQKVPVILQALEDANDQQFSTTYVKDKLGEAVSYNDIRAVIRYREKLQQEAGKV